MPNNATQKISLKFEDKFYSKFVGVGVRWGTGKPLFDYKLDSH